jgi:hypothetical protein
LWELIAIVWSGRIHAFCFFQSQSAIQFARNGNVVRITLFLFDFLQLTQTLSMSGAHTYAFRTLLYISSLLISAQLWVTHPLECSDRWFKVKVKQSHYGAGQARRVSGGSGSQILKQSVREDGKFVSPTHRPLLPTEIIPGTHFC